jgi:hypothetical protein
MDYFYQGDRGLLVTIQKDENGAMVVVAISDEDQRSNE